ncbi:MAG: RtcB family protein [Methanomassiliicoccus sp.]|nr:RtcB family protein [Methanomassiliicoccus sp.]
MPYTGPLEKIDDFRWRIPKSYREGMRTDAIIFASERMVPSLREDNAPEQAANVAYLPGIVGSSLAMPDIHWGYGFPIGGVAAMDAEEGVISPGGIGFDINCLCEGSRVSTGLGGWMKIEDFEREFGTSSPVNDGLALSLMEGKTSVMTLEKGLVERKPSAFMRKPSDRRVLKITTRTGLELRCSEDHPLLTDNGMRSAMLLRPGEKVAVSYFQGVEVEPQADRREIILAKIFGYMLGDGALYRTGRRLLASAYGAKEDLERMQSDLRELGYSSKVYGRTRDHSIPTHYGVVEFTATSYELHVHSREFSNLLLERGMPVGKKTVSDHRVPDWVMNGSLPVKRAFVAGLFGAELTTPKAVSKTCFFMPTLSQNKNDEHLESGRLFLIDVMRIMEELGVETQKISESSDFFNQRGKTSRLRLHISSDEENVIRLYRAIGYEYCRRKSMVADVAVKYMLLKKLLLERRTAAAAKTKELKRKGLKLKEVQDLLVGDDINARFIERHYYEDVGRRITLDFIPFKEFLETELTHLESSGSLFDEIASVEEVPYSGSVYDFTVVGTHNFVADGIVVSNCGVRLIRTDLEEKDVRPGIKDLIGILFKNVPAGVGSQGVVDVASAQIDDILERGAEWAVESGYGWKEDLDVTEEGGRMKTADPTKVSSKAKQRGVPQVGSLGSGNHFLEVDVVDEVFDQEAAKAFGLREGQITVSVHCGSRGCGHQIATDYLQVMERYVRQSGMQLPDRQLACAPVRSKEGEDYYKAMSCGANFAWANRQMILHWIRQSFEQHFKRDAESMGMHQVYDVAHNIAKLEEHLVDGQKRKVYVHRKGATRAFPAGRPEVPVKYRSIGQPVLIPGDMGNGSYVLIGTDRTMSESFGSTCHGAGRVMSRNEALRKFTVQGIRDELAGKGIFLKSATKDGILEEAPEAYKNIESVIDVVVGAGLSKKVARLTPIGVMKG